MIGAEGQTGVAELDQPDSPSQPLVAYSATEGDQSLERVARLAADRGLPIRMRISISLWDWTQYVAWKRQTWRVEVQDKAGAEAVQLAMEAFFDLVAKVGPASAIDALNRLNVAPGAGQETADGTIAADPATTPILR